jgi:hypothetical protein
MPVVFAPAFMEPCIPQIAEYRAVYADNGQVQPSPFLRLQTMANLVPQRFNVMG